ncbi:MAG: MogA/MoaB family molybdenum cofactor biosynthesis protein [Desulfocapsaceae bacterium]|jgi:molybdenum cofactor synthesis domain-containing protein|nr:MogA/MoaB family molybdenum cofactor biosynthesis protein [Desulfocapsaceae bacterium]
MQMQAEDKHGDELFPYRFAVITMSDKGFRGERTDTSGAALKELLIGHGYQLCHYSIVPDQVEHIVDAVNAAISLDNADLIVTTGGTGVSPSDVTPEAMDSLIDRELPGIAEAMRASSLLLTPMAVLSRGRAGIRGNTLIINLPGSRKAALENIEVVLPALRHAVEKIKGSTADCGR